MTVTEAMEAVARLTGLKFSVVQNLHRTLRNAGLLPRSGHGGGKAAAHVTSQHLATVVLALAAVHPSEAVERISTLGRLQPFPSGPILLNVITVMIEAARTGQCDGPTLELDCSNPVAFIERGGEADVFGAYEPLPTEPTRSVVVPWDLLQALGQLLATPHQRPEPPHEPTRPGALH